LAWRWLIDPASVVRTAVERRRAVTLAGIALTILAHGILSTLMDPDARGIHATVALLAGAAYALSRTSHLRIGGILGTLACATTPLVGMATPESTTSAPEEIIWLVAAVGLPGLCMPLRWAVAASVAIAAAAVGSALVNPGIPEEAAIEIGALTLLVAVLSAVYAVIRGRNEADLERATALAEQVVDSMVDAVFVVGPDGRIQRVNGAASAMLDRPSEALVGTPMKDLLGLEGEERDRACRRLQSGDLQAESLELGGAGGDSVPVSLSSGPIQTSPGGEVLGHVCVARDMRETLRLLAESAEAQVQRERAEELEAVNRRLVETQEQLVQTAKLATVGELAASVAHELNNPLLAILGYTSLLEQQLEPDSGPPGAHRYVARTATAARRCQAIVRRWLDFARRSGGEYSPIDMTEVIDTASALAAPQLHKNGAELQVQTNGGLEVQGDPTQLGQVLMNLLVNAGHAVDGKGTIRITATCDEDEVRVSVQDDGCGMSEEVLAKAREPFFTTKPAGHGTGLGLSITDGILADHRGRLEIESTVGVGSTFTVILPVFGEP